MKKIISETECPQCGCVATDFPEENRIVCDYCGFQKNGDTYTKGYGSIWWCDDKIQLLHNPLPISERISLYENKDVLNFYIWDEDLLEVIKGNDLPKKMQDILKEQADLFQYEHEHRSFNIIENSTPY